MHRFQRKLKLLGLLLIGISFLSLKANDPLTQKILDYFFRLQTEFPVEKVHLHLDSDSYTLGDDIWFSVYLTAGAAQVPSPLSKTLYVQLLDSDGDLVLEKIVLVENGFGQGDFQLPAFGQEGIYKIKAFTAWMENFGAEHFYYQEINVFDGNNRTFYPQVIFEEKTHEGQFTKYSVSIETATIDGNPLENVTLGLNVFGDFEKIVEREILLNSKGQASFSFSLPFKPYSKQWLELIFRENEAYEVKKRIKIPYSFLLADIQFLPEGGHLVKGFKSNVAFKAIYPDGSPVDLEGQILGDMNESRFETFYGGMGKFQVTPSDEPIQVNVKEKQSKEYLTLNLPPAKANGLVIQILNNPNQSYLTAYLEGNVTSEEFILVNHSKGNVNFLVTGSLPNGIWSVRIPKNKLQQGVNYVTVLNKEGMPIIERLFFLLEPKEQIDIEVSKTTGITPRSLISLDIRTTLKQTPHGGRFSVSITDFDQMTGNTSSNSSLLNTLLLNSDLKGQLSIPNYFLESQQELAHTALDLVMLTNGWRKFNWEDVISQTYPNINKPIEQGINVSGVVKSIDGSKRGLKGGTINAIIGQGDAFSSTSFNSDGYFIFPNLTFFENTPITVSAKDDRQREFLEVVFQKSTRTPEITQPSIPNEIMVPKSLIETFRSRQLMSSLNSKDQLIELKEFEVKNQTLAQENLEERRIYGEGDVVLVPDKIPGSQAFMNVFEMIQGRVAGVQVTVSGMNASVLIRGPGSINAGIEPFFLLDNVPVDIQTLMQVNPRDVEAIDVFKDPIRTSIFGAQGANGAIAVYTKSGLGVDGLLRNSSVNHELVGYSVAREFYQPAYNTISIETATTDRRKTIYWNPNLQVDSFTPIQFYNTDIAKKYLLIIEGMDSTGRMGRVEKIIE
jgi:hypothetical protein